MKTKEYEGDKNNHEILIQNVKNFEFCEVCFLLSLYIGAVKKTVQCFQCKRIFRRPQSVKYVLQYIAVTFAFVRLVQTLDSKR